jgi:hypothetical protein
MPQSRLFADTRPEYVDPMLLSVARDLRERAEEVLARAETFRDANAREMMHRIAWSYEKLARRLEHEGARAGEA